MEKTPNELAEEYARNHSNAPDKETPDWIIADFLAGYRACEKEKEQEIKELVEALWDASQHLKTHPIYDETRIEEILKKYDR